jgi:hypothetical protein
MKFSPKNIRRLLYWSSVAVFITVIFLTLPYAPVWRDWLSLKLGEKFLPISVAVIIALILLWSLIRLICKRGRFSDYLFFVLIIAGYVYSLYQIKIEVEKVHFLEYGLLAVLFISALRLERKDPPQYLNSILLVTLTGIVDEYIQGILPSRVGELHDVYLNILSGALSLAWYRLCVKPVEIARALWRKGLAIALPVSALIILSFAVFNSRISGFGYLIRDPEIGAFYSRLPAQKLVHQLPEVEKFRKVELPRLYREDYENILNEVKNPIHSEALVHIFRRDKRLKRDRDYYIGYYENKILEKYFSPYIVGTEHQWPQEFKNRVQAAAADRLSEFYLSPVSAHLVTSFTAKTQWIAVVILEMLIFSIWGLLIFPKKRASNNETSA